MVYRPYSRVTQFGVKMRLYPLSGVADSISKAEEGKVATLKSEHCCVRWCSNDPRIVKNRAESSFHRFPRKKDVRRLWLL